MVTLIVTALLPVFLCLALGYFAGHRKLVDNRNVASLNVLLMQFALPLTLFVSIARTPQQVILQNGRLALVIVLTLVIVYLPMFWLQRRSVPAAHRRRGRADADQLVPELRVHRAAVAAAGVRAGPRHCPWPSRSPWDRSPCRR